MDKILDLEAYNVKHVVIVKIKHVHRVIYNMNLIGGISDEHTFYKSVVCVDFKNAHHDEKNPEPRIKYTGGPNYRLQLSDGTKITGSLHEYCIYLNIYNSEKEICTICEDENFACKLAQLINKGVDEVNAKYASLFVSKDKSGLYYDNNGTNSYIVQNADRQINAGHPISYLLQQNKAFSTENEVGIVREKERLLRGLWLLYFKFNNSETENESDVNTNSKKKNISSTRYRIEFDSEKNEYVAVKISKNRLSPGIPEFTLEGANRAIKYLNNHKNFLM